MRQPLVPMIFPVLGSHICGEEFQYHDPSWKEPTGMLAIWWLKVAKQMGKEEAVLTKEENGVAKVAKVAKTHFWGSPEIGFICRYGKIAVCNSRRTRKISKWRYDTSEEGTTYMMKKVLAKLWPFVISFGQAKKHDFGQSLGYASGHQHKENKQ